MEFKIEVKDGEKLTTYTADTAAAETVVKEAVEGFGKFLKATFKREVYTKEQ